MNYENTPVKVKPSKEAIKKYKESQAITELQTRTIVWHLVKKHKFGLVSTYAIVLTMLYFVPFLPDMILSLFGE